MEDLSEEAMCTPSNEKSCQTDDLYQEATMPGPDQASRTPVYSLEPGDPPLLQRPLETSMSGIQQIIECFRSGTTKLKHMLLKEVDTIFECKLCRSLFRGLPNLITHKQFYCRLPEPGEHLGDGRQNLGLKELLDPQLDKQDYVVRLEPIEGNQNAVFQHLMREDGLECPLPSDGAENSMDSWKDKRLESPKQTQEDQVTREGEEDKEVEGEEQVKVEAKVTLEEKEEEEEEEEHSESVDGRLDCSSPSAVTITCCFCGKDFSSQRNVRRHCRKMHKQRLEELSRFTDTRMVPISLLSVVKDRQTAQMQPSSPRETSCPVCFKTFATRANVCRHFDEVHRDLCRELVTPDIAASSAQLEPSAPPLPDTLEPVAQYNLDACKCLLCKRTYSAQNRLMRHLRIVHKIVTLRSSPVPSSDAVKSEYENPNSSLCPSFSSHLANHKRPREEEGEDEDGPLSCKPRFSVGFDFKQLFCKLCKRQFSSRQNLTKHIELHTDNGTDLFIKFYRCPLCSYESRRKRDVLRHISVVHKKSNAYLNKILPSLETRAVKKPIDVVLEASGKRSRVKEEVADQHSPASWPAEATAPPSPPVTRKHCLLPQNQSSGSQDGVEVRLTKNFSLHACEMCGRAFAKKVYLESHKRSHRNAASSDGRRTGVSTRSKSLLG